jgi:hypothetical protein
LWKLVDPFRPFSREAEQHGSSGIEVSFLPRFPSSSSLVSLTLPYIVRYPHAPSRSRYLADLVPLPSSLSSPFLPLRLFLSRLTSGTPFRYALDSRTLSIAFNGRFDCNNTEEGRKGKAKEALRRRAFSTTRRGDDFLSTPLFLLLLPSAFSPSFSRFPSVLAVLEPDDPLPASSYYPTVLFLSLADLLAFRSRRRSPPSCCTRSLAVTASPSPLAIGAGPQVLSSFPLYRHKHPNQLQLTQCKLNADTSTARTGTSKSFVPLPVSRRPRFLVVLTFSHPLLRYRESPTSSSTIRKLTMLLLSLLRRPGCPSGRDVGPLSSSKWWLKLSASSSTSSQVR